MCRTPYCRSRPLDNNDHCEHCIERVWRRNECANRYCLLRGRRTPRMRDGLCDSCRHRRQSVNPRSCRVGACQNPATEGKGDEFCESCRTTIKACRDLVNQERNRRIAERQENDLEQGESVEKEVVEDIKN